MRRILLVVTVGLVMAATMAFGAGAAFAAKGGGGPHSCDDPDEKCIDSGGGSAPDGGGSGGAVIYEGLTLARVGGGAAQVVAVADALLRRIPSSSGNIP